MRQIPFGNTKRISLPQQYNLILCQTFCESPRGLFYVWHKYCALDMMIVYGGKLSVNYRLLVMVRLKNQRWLLIYGFIGFLYAWYMVKLQKRKNKA